MKSLLGKLGVILIGLAIFGCAGMRGASWKSFSSTDLFEGFYYVSKSHLLYKGTVLVSVKLEYTEKGIAEHIKEFGKDYENLSYSLQSWEVDCRAKTERILSNNRYSVEGNLINTKSAKGRLSDNRYSVEGNLINTKSAKGRLSESIGKSLSEVVCK